MPQDAEEVVRLVGGTRAASKRHMSGAMCRSISRHARDLSRRCKWCSCPGNKYGVHNTYFVCNEGEDSDDCKDALITEVCYVAGTGLLGVSTKVVDPSQCHRWWQVRACAKMGACGKTFHWRFNTNI